MASMMSLKERAIIDTTSSIRNATVLVVSASGQVLHFVEWRRALLMINAGQAYTIETVKRLDADGVLGEALIHSPSVAIPLPLIVGLMPHVYVPSVAFVQSKTETAGRVAVLRRDGRVCAYCNSRRANTVDHIFPKCRGGRFTWQNLVAACAKCNTKKADRTPEEAGMPMLFDPRVMEGGVQDLQAEAWAYMRAAAGVAG